MRLSTLLTVALMCACAFPRIPWVEGRFDPVPTIKIYLIDPSAGAGQNIYREVTSDASVLITPGLALSALVRADGRNGVGSLNVEAKVDGNLTAAATVLDHIDSNGYVASTLVISGTDGAGGLGPQPIRFQLADGQTGALYVRASTPLGSAREITVQFTTTCPCPFGTVFDKFCNCGCQPGVSNPTPKLVDPLPAPMCGFSCCAIGERCRQSDQRCALPVDPRSTCPSGSVCTNPAFPICRFDFCYPY